MLTGFDPDRRSAIGGKLSGETARAGGEADRWLSAAMTILLIALVLHAIAVLWLGLFQPIIDRHAFRQTQTALSAYWLWKGGPWLAYETPVLGSPWSIPLEFPLYQYLVALLRLAGIPIDISGRLVSFGFYLGCLWPLRLLFQTQRLGRFSYLAVAILFLSSPLYLFWGRTVMIESCALFFGLLWLALLGDFLSRPRPTALLWTVLAGTAASLVKLTTFPAFLLLGGALLLHHALRNGLSQPHRRTLAMALAGFVIPLILGYAWVAYSDAVKQQNPFGALLTSAGLWTWNFGSLAQRWSSALWLRTVLQRALPDDFGYGVPLAIALAGIALASRRFAGPAIAALLAFLAPFLVFTKIGHGYDPEKELYASFLAEQIARSGLSEHVVLLDEVTDLAPAYAMADVFYLASRLDPLPNVTIDAAMYGLPIICFDGASGMAEILRRDATAGLTVVPHLAADAAARRIVELVDDELRERIGKATRALAQGIFDMDLYVDRIDEIGGQAIESMRQRRADFETLQDDSLFDAGISLPHNTRRDAAICASLAYWSATRTAPHQIDYIDLRRSCAGFNPQIYAHYHPDLLQADINPFAEFIRKGRPQGPWLHPVIRPELSVSDSSLADLRTAIQAHFHYPELIRDFLAKLAVNAGSCDLLLSTDEEWKAGALRASTVDYSRGRVDIRVVPNRGRDLGPLLTSYGNEILENYDVIGHFHGKRSLGVDPAMGEIWREFLWQHLVGDLYPMMDVAVSHFAKEDHLGLVFAEEPHLCDWSANLALSETLAVRMGIEPPLPPFFEFPVGSMFWARPSALSPLLDLKLDWDDYPEEPVPGDGTILHALERLIPFSVGKVGLSWSTVHIPGVIR